MTVSSTLTDEVTPEGLTTASAPEASMSIKDRM